MALPIVISSRFLRSLSFWEAVRPSWRLGRRWRGPHAWGMLSRFVGVVRFVFDGNLNSLGRFGVREFRLCSVVRHTNLRYRGLPLERAAATSRYATHAILGVAPDRVPCRTRNVSACPGAARSTFQDQPRRSPCVFGRTIGPILTGVALLFAASSCADLQGDGQSSDNAALGDALPGTNGTTFAAAKANFGGRGRR